jgi:two-component system response regulator HydG
MSSGPVLQVVDLPTQLQDFCTQRLANLQVLPAGENPPGADPAATIVSIADMERQAILDTLRQLQGDKLTAARLLGIGKTTLYRKLKEYGLAEATHTPTMSC